MSWWSNAAAALLILIVGTAYAQTEMAVQDTLTIHILEETVTVMHKVWAADEPQHLHLIPGDVIGITVRAGTGEPLDYHVVEGGIVIAASPEDAYVSYELDGVVQRVGTVWQWDFLYPRTTIFVFEHDIDTIYANGQPVALTDTNKVRCHGCQMNIQYTKDEPVRAHTIQWANYTFNILVRSHDTIQEISFHQPTRSIELDVDGGSFLTVQMPQRLLGGPYEVILNDAKVWFHQKSNDTHTEINVLPDEAGTITIVGTTAIPEFGHVFLATVLATVLFIILHKTHTNRNRTRLSGNYKAGILFYS